MAITIGRICGIISPLIGLIFVWIAVYESPWFSWTEDDLSILGVIGPAAKFFCWGLVSFGLLSLVFIVDLGKSRILHSQPLGYIGIISLVLGSASLVMVGLFPRTMAIPHNLASGAFFILIPFGMFIFGLSLIMSRQLPWGLFSLTSAILIVGLHLAPWPWKGAAIPQLLSVLPWSLWIITVSIRLLL